jgi:hypothetical protein
MYSIFKLLWEQSSVERKLFFFCLRTSFICLDSLKFYTSTCKFMDAVYEISYDLTPAHFFIMWPEPLQNFWIRKFHICFALFVRTQILIFLGINLKICRLYYTLPPWCDLESFFIISIRWSCLWNLPTEAPKRIGQHPCGNLKLEASSKNMGRKRGSWRKHDAGFNLF